MAHAGWRAGCGSGSAAAVTTAAPASGRRSSKPPPAVFVAQLETLLARGTRVLAIYAGGHQERYNHPDQIFELFPHLRGRLDRRYFPHVNDTFTELGAQADLFGAVSEWIEQHFR